MKPSFDGDSFNLDLWDSTMGGEFDRLRTNSYNQADFFLLCFSMVDPASFDSITTKWLPEVQFHAPYAKCVLVGLKLDARMMGQESIPSEKAYELSNKIGAVKYIECSSLTQMNTKELFEDIMRINKENPREIFIKKQGCTLL